MDKNPPINLDFHTDGPRSFHRNFGQDRITTMLNSRCILKIRPFEESGSYRWLVFFFFFLFRFPFLKSRIT